MLVGEVFGDVDLDDGEEVAALALGVFDAGATEAEFAFSDVLFFRVRLRAPAEETK